MPALKGKTALVVGAAGRDNMGQVIARRLADEGARVMVVGRCIANEYGARGIRANSISPGITETPMTAGAKTVPGLWETYLKRYPLGRTGKSADIAAAVAWLASDECFMTGQNLQVNGGLTLRGNPSSAEIDAAVLAATGKPRPRPWQAGAGG